MDLVWANQETAAQTKAELGKTLKQIRMGVLEGLCVSPQELLVLCPESL